MTLRVNGPDRRALMFGLGRNNNGTGMVLAASGMASLPAAIVPVLAYNLVQHVVAGLISKRMSNRSQRSRLSFIRVERVSK